MRKTAPPVLYNAKNALQSHTYVLYSVVTCATSKAGGRLELERLELLRDRLTPDLSVTIT